MTRLEGLKEAARQVVKVGAAASYEVTLNQHALTVRNRFTGDLLAWLNPVLFTPGDLPGGAYGQWREAEPTLRA